MQIRYLCLPVLLLVSSSFAKGQTAPNTEMCRGGSYTLSDPANLLSASTARLGKRMAEIVGGCLSNEMASTKIEQQSVEAEKENFLASKEFKDFEVEAQPLNLELAAQLALKPGLKIRDNELKLETVRIKSLTPAPGDTKGLEIYNGEVAKYMTKWTQLVKDTEASNKRIKQIQGDIVKLPTFIIAEAKEAEIRSRLKAITEKAIKLQQAFERSFLNWREIKAIQTDKYKVTETGTIPSFFGTQDVDTKKVNLRENIEKLKALADEDVDFDQRKKP